MHLPWECIIALCKWHLRHSSSLIRVLSIVPSLATKDRFNDLIERLRLSRFLSRALAALSSRLWTSQESPRVLPHFRARIGTKTRQINCNYYINCNFNGNVTFPYLPRSSFRSLRQKTPHILINALPFVVISARAA